MTILSMAFLGLLPISNQRKAIWLRQNRTEEAQVESWITMRRLNQSLQVPHTGEIQ
jgi:hypothetical protein